MWAYLTDWLWLQAYFTLSSNGNYTGAWAELGFAEADPLAKHCWRINADSPLLKSMAQQVDMGAIGTPGWQARHPCESL